MNIQGIKYFIVLAETGHYTRASEKLGITQPSLSYAIKELERELGLPLFEPGHRTELTIWGRKFLSHARQSMASLYEGIKEIKLEAEGKGSVRLGFLRVLGTDIVPSLASSYSAQYPNAAFSFSSGRTADLLARLESSQLDIVFAPAGRIGEEYSAAELFSLPLSAAVSATHPLAAQSKVSMKELARYPFLQYTEGAGLRDIIEKAFEEAGVKPYIAYESEEAPVLAGLAARNFGAAIVLKSEIPQLDGLRMLDIEPGISFPISAIISTQHTMGPTALAFLDYVKTAIKTVSKKNTI